MRSTDAVEEGVTVKVTKYEFQQHRAVVVSQYSGM